MTPDQLERFNLDAQEFIAQFSGAAMVAHCIASEHGFWSAGQGNDSEKIMLIVTELAEAVEGLRHGNPPSDHIPEFNAAEEEFADAIIRMMDLWVKRGWRVPEAIVAKMAFNLTREHKHGKGF